MRSTALDDSEREKILSANEEMATDALRVLAIAYSDLPEADDYNEELIEKDLVFLGLIGMMDPPREEAVEAVRVCRQVAIKPIMITGDHKLTAVAVAKELGIHREGDLVFTGEDLSKIDDNEFERVVDKITVYARVSPLDKLKIVKAWKNRGEVVAMTGDGVNDAPALKHADIGIAMGITGTEVAKEAADIVLSDDNFATIVRAIERGRWIYDNIKKYLTYLLQSEYHRSRGFGRRCHGHGARVLAAASGGDPVYQPGHRRASGARAGCGACGSGYHAETSARSSGERVFKGHKNADPDGGIHRVPHISVDVLSTPNRIWSLRGPGSFSCSFSSSSSSPLTFAL